MEGKGESSSISWPSDEEREWTERAFRFTSSFFSSLFKREVSLLDLLGVGLETELRVSDVCSAG